MRMFLIAAAALALPMSSFHAEEPPELWALSFYGSATVDQWEEYAPSGISPAYLAVFPTESYCVTAELSFNDLHLLRTRTDKAGVEVEYEMIASCYPVTPP